MERTEEFAKIVGIYKYQDSADKEPASFQQKAPLPLSSYVKTALRAFSSLEENDAVLKTIEKLTLRKEFSNDPTLEMTEASGLFQRNLTRAQPDIQQLKREIESLASYVQNHHKQHLKFILDNLIQRQAAQLEKFKELLKVHSSHVEQRQQRVSRYGVNNDQFRVKSRAALSIPVNRPDAIFENGNANAGSSSSDRNNTSNANNTTVSTVSNDKNSNDSQGIGMGVRTGSYSTGNNSFFAPGEIRRRTNALPPHGMAAGTPADHVIPSSSGSGPSESMQQAMYRSDDRMRHAQKVETAIAQMGGLFTQMAQLVAQQSDTIANIEDDVESGLTNTTTGYNSLLQLQEITKGNRGMILKILALLVFFILLFLVWT